MANLESKNRVSILESLPDELLLDILEYLSVQDLYDGFYHLNYRFRMILNSLTHVHGEVTFSNELSSAAFRYFARRMTILTMHQIEMINVAHVTQIRSLILHHEPNRNECQWIQSFSNLQSLLVVINPLGPLYYSVSLPYFIFTNTYPQLQSCQMNLVPYRLCPNWTCVPSLRSVNVCIENPRIYAQILCSCPSLIRMKVQLTRYFARPIAQSDDPTHRSLHRLELCLNQTMYSCGDVIDLFLSMVPHLTILNVQGLSVEAYNVNLNALGTILRRRVAKLRYFHFDMSIEEPLANHLLAVQRLDIHRLHPLFTHFRVSASTDHAAARLIIDSNRSCHRISRIH